MRSALLALTLLLTACQTSQVAVDYDTTVDFSDYQRYVWLQERSGAGEELEPLMAQRVQAAVAAQLAAGRFTEVDTRQQADFLVRYFISRTATTETSRARGSVGMGRMGGSTGVGVSVGFPIGGTRIERQAQVVVDILDANNEELVWRGTNRIEWGDAKPEEIAERINDAVAEIFDRFPPQGS